MPMTSLEGEHIDSVPILSLKFASSYEPRLDQLIPLARKATARAPGGCISGDLFPAVPVFDKPFQVCTNGRAVTFEGPDDSYSYFYAPGGNGADDGCVFHLNGRWWEESDAQTDGGDVCPFGFYYIGP
jgi:hypothetical protein